MTKSSAISLMLSAAALSLSLYVWLDKEPKPTFPQSLSEVGAIISPPPRASSPQVPADWMRVTLRRPNITVDIPSSWDATYDAIPSPVIPDSVAEPASHPFPRLRLTWRLTTVLPDGVRYYPFLERIGEGTVGRRGYPAVVYQDKATNSPAALVVVYTAATRLWMLYVFYDGYPLVRGSEQLAIVERILASIDHGI